MTYYRFILLLITQFKLLNRYLRIPVLFILLFLYTFAFAFLKHAFGKPIHLPFVTMIINILFIGFLFSEYFIAGVNEKIFYAIFSSKIRNIVLTNNVALMIIIWILPIPIFIIELIYFSSTWHEIYDALQYVVITTPGYVYLLDIFSTSIKKPTRYISTFVQMFLQVINILLASTPYAILHLWSTSNILYIIVCLFIFCFWYFYGVTSIVNYFRQSIIGAIQNQ